MATATQEKEEVSPAVVIDVETHGPMLVIVWRDSPVPDLEGMEWGCRGVVKGEGGLAVRAFLRYDSSPYLVLQALAARFSEPQ